MFWRFSSWSTFYTFAWAIWPTWTALREKKWRKREKSVENSNFYYEFSIFNLNLWYSNFTRDWADRKVSSTRANLALGFSRHLHFCSLMLVLHGNKGDQCRFLRAESGAGYVIFVGPPSQLLILLLFFWPNFIIASLYSVNRPFAKYVFWFPLRPAKTLQFLCSCSWQKRRKPVLYLLLRHGENSASLLLKLTY